MTIKGKDLKFRAWIYEWKEMYPVSGFNFEENSRDRNVELTTCGHKLGCCTDWFGWDDVDVMQYTGLKDKNGVEIYEGDIVEFTVFDHNGHDTQHKGVVKFAHGQWELWKRNNDEFYGSDGAFNLYWVHSQDVEVEVIGNIYENKELLNDN